MSSTNQQNLSLVRSVTNLALLTCITAGFAVACVSSSNDTTGTGGSSNGGESGTATGGAVTNGGTPSTSGGSTGTNNTSAGTGGAATACAPSTLAVTGNVCTVNPPLFALNDTCSFGDWNMTNNTLSGGLAAWSGLTGTCTGGAFHVTGSYGGSQLAKADGTFWGGNAGFNTFYNAPTATGVGCSIVDASQYQGLTLDVDATTVPSNKLIVGVNLADGNAAETTVTLTAGSQTVPIKWGQLTKKANCGPATGSDITGIYYVFLWFQDSAMHDVDATFSNVGFY